MKLVYCWITNYLNIKDQGFNFGSEWIYTTTVNSKKSLTIKRTKNEKYVDDFFKLDGVGFENVTAIVGENGAGKSNILEFLATTMLKPSEAKQVPMRSLARFLGISLDDYFILYENEEKQLFIQYKLTNYKLSESTFALPCEVLTGEVLKKLQKESQIIYYSPIYDFRNIGDSNEIINISSNYFLLKDLYSANSQNDERIESTEFHKIAETRRQLLFLNDESIKNIVDEILKKLSIPNNVTLTTSQIALPLTPEGITNELRNIVILHPIIEKAVDFYIRERKLLTEKLLNNPQLLQYLEFLYTLFVAIIRSTDSQYFDASKSGENFIPVKNALESLSFSDTFSYKPEKIELQFKIFLDTLLDNQTYFNKENIEEIIGSLEFIANGKVSHFTIQRADALSFLKSYEKLINNYTSEKSPRSMTTGFLDFLGVA
jgi:energy-coupling factor transporter ATP-binding protein EcfA2